MIVLPLSGLSLLLTLNSFSLTCLLNIAVSWCSLTADFLTTLLTFSCLYCFTLHDSAVYWEGIFFFSQVLENPVSFCDDGLHCCFVLFSDVDCMVLQLLGRILLSANPSYRRSRVTLCFYMDFVWLSGAAYTCVLLLHIIKCSGGGKRGSNVDMLYKQLWCILGRYN